MLLDQYYRQILLPANSAVSAIRRAGIPVDVVRVRELREAWAKELAAEEAFVEGEAAKRGVVLKYSEKHSMSPKKLSDFLFGKPGLGLTFPDQMKSWEMRQEMTEGKKGDYSTSAEVLSWFASLSVPRPDDNPVVRSIMRVRSLAGSISKYLDKFESARRADGAVHPTYNWALRTSRISASNPPMHGITERADPYVAAGIKSCIVPRVEPFRVREWDPKTGNFGGWDPRIHGWCGRWDISGAEAVIRAAMLTHRYCKAPEPLAWEYLRLGKDIHGKTASLIYNAPDGTYKKGSYERDAVGKQTFFAKIFGANWRTVQGTIWKKARLWLPDAKAQETDANFDKGYPGLVELYTWDKLTLGRRAVESGNNVGWCSDGYGRRRSIPLPDGVTFDENYATADSWSGGDSRFPGYQFDVGNKRNEKEMKRALNHAFHIMANCVDAKTEALTRRGWVKGFDLLTDDVLLTKNAATGALEWQKMLDLKLWPDYAGPLVEFKSKSFHAVTTPDHRWLVRAGRMRDIETTSAHLKLSGSHKIHLTGDYDPVKVDSILSPDEAEMMGWFLTDGYVRKCRQGGQITTRGRTYPKPTPRVLLVQSISGNPVKCHRIDDLLVRLASGEMRKWVQCSRRRDTGAKYIHATWSIGPSLSAKILSLCPDRVLTLDLLSNLSRVALDRLKEAMILGDGCISGQKTTFVTASKDQAEAFQVLCTLTGDSASVRWRDSAKYSGEGRWNSPVSPGIWTVTVLRRRYAHVQRHQRRDFVGSLAVWCPVVPNTFFVARRSGTVFVTGNTPTQSMNATDNFWMLALAYHGEGLVEEMGGLQVPAMWAKDGVPFPEAAGWQMHEGAGPGGRPLRSWHSNTVHDSGWFDGAPGHLEPTAKLITRRCTSLPFDWRLEADVPYRIDLSVGPDMANLADYNVVVKAFGLEPMPKK
jgi:hypothetical protein